MALRTATPPDLIDFMGVAFSDRQPERRAAFAAQARAMAQVGQLQGSSRALEAFCRLGSALVGARVKERMWQAGHRSRLLQGLPCKQCLDRLALPRGDVLQQGVRDRQITTSAARLATPSAVDTGCQTLEHHKLEPAHFRSMYDPVTRNIWLRCPGGPGAPAARRGG